MYIHKQLKKKEYFRRECYTCQYKVTIKTTQYNYTNTSVNTNILHKSV